MKEPPIYVTDADHRLLTALLESVACEESRDPASADALRHELERATIVPAEQMPSYVVTLYTRFRLKDLDTGEVQDYTLVLPGQAAPRAGTLSVLAPLGTALLGYKDLDVVEWVVPAGRRRFRVEAVLYQPEADGIYGAPPPFARRLQAGRREGRPHRPARRNHPAARAA